MPGAQGDGIAPHDQVEITHMLQPAYDTFSPGPGEGVQAASGRLIICGYYNNNHGGAANVAVGEAVILLTPPLHPYRNTY